MDEGDDHQGGVSIPRLSDREEVGRQIRMIRRFLDQHPDARERLIEVHYRRLDRWLAKRRLTLAERLLVRIVLYDWQPERRGELVAELLTACHEGFDLSELTDVRDQELLLELGLSEAEWQPVAVAGLASRLPAIRERARAAIDERLSPEGARHLYLRVMEESPARGDAVLEVATMIVDGSAPTLAQVDNVMLFLKLLAIVSEPERDALRNRALKLMAPDGPVFARLHVAEPRAGEIDRVAAGLLSFRASDQFLNPIVASLEQAWGPEASAALRERRRQEGEKIAARMDDDSGFPTVLFMSRASHDELRTEIERVDLELKTTIPRAIRKARELGDLRENAEYESAKLKQRQFSDRLAQLLATLDRAAIIEEAEIDGTVAMVGTEVWLTVVDSGESLSYWMLGYNDSQRGTNAISFESEIGRALWRARAGDELDLPGAAGARRVRVERIEQRLP